MKITKRCFAWMLTLLLLCGLFPFGVFATSEELETNTGQEGIEEESPTGEDTYTSTFPSLWKEPPRTEAKPTQPRTPKWTKPSAQSSSTIITFQ